MGFLINIQFFILIFHYFKKLKWEIKNVVLTSNILTKFNPKIQ